MEIRVLKYFLAVSREESISRAAEYLHLSQPTLSRQLMQLEEYLGCKLMNRSRRNHKVSLTDEGIRLRRRAEEIVELIDKTEAEFTARDDTVSGDIYIGGGETDAMRFIAKTARELQHEYPHIHYHLFSGNAEDIADRLEKGLLDFAVLVGTADKSKYDFLSLPVSDIWGLLMPKDCPLAAKKGIRPEDLIDLPLLVSRQALAYNELSGWQGGGFDTLNIVATYNLIFNAALMVEEGFGYALALEKIVNTSGNSKLCFRRLEPRLEAHLDIVWKKYQVFSKATAKFIERLQKKILSEDS